MASTLQGVTSSRSSLPSNSDQQYADRRYDSLILRIGMLFDEQALIVNPDASEPCRKDAAVFAAWVNEQRRRHSSMKTESPQEERARARAIKALARQIRRLDKFIAKYGDLPIGDPDDQSGETGREPHDGDGGNNSGNGGAA